MKEPETYRNPKYEQTHTFLDNGTLNLPEHDKELMQKFYGALAAAILSRQPVCISEKRTPVFNYYIDFSSAPFIDIYEEEEEHFPVDNPFDNFSQENHSIQK